LCGSWRKAASLTKSTSSDSSSFFFGITKLDQRISLLIPLGELIVRQALTGFLRILFLLRFLGAQERVKFPVGAEQNGFRGPLPNPEKYAIKAI
jgi:hypothetical protein